MHNLTPKDMANVVSLFFKMQIPHTHIVNIDYPEIGPRIYAIWHAHQCCLVSVPEREKINIMISKSRDGEIIANVVESMGFKVVHGSKGKQGATEATLQMISELKNGNHGAITVDGPNGPAKVCKSGIIKIAKLSGAPIIPLIWYSPNPSLLKFPTWDKFEFPFLSTNLINLYGSPIYVDKDSSDEQDKQKRIEVENALLDLYQNAKNRYKDIYRFGLWKKKK